MLTPYMPFPPSAGGQIRSYNLIKHLGKRHEIHLVALVKNDDEKRYAKQLKKFCKKIYVCKRSESPWTPTNILKSVIGMYPFLVVRNYSREAEITVQKLLSSQTFDLIHAETFYIMPHIPQTAIPIFLVEQTIEFMVYQHFVNRIKFPFLRPFFLPDILKLKYWERTFWKRARLVGAVSEEDEAKMHELVPHLKTTTIPNAAGEDLLHIYAPIKKTIKPVFLYIGNYSWLQNVEGAQILMRSIFPLIKKIIPEASCIIAGQRAFEKLGHESGYGIEIVDIPATDTKEKVVDVYSRSSIFLAPLEGPGGTRLKVLGAMAAGIPVVSSQTGISGLEVTHGKDVFIAQTREEFAQYSVQLLKDLQLYNRMRQNAHKLIENVYSWDSISQKLEKIYLALTQSYHARRN
ncbi:hypothetical protein A3B02_00575 [Candidatus Roizmanbacteria bacterium RIFCSPLOWO2_01_FULL_42_14]|uniref:Glycosyltransferase subfamily 4-like N-terminal domain-containing protein n=2 Tax=Candidatus Roizmaniibacteriota TaxID=1752723 RepID=A0A1F7J9R9_9BACT|nr:MAG: hypothetical protein A3F32_01685 [Candidatus Roizmanbacteria bacterium RIFCSPHIGHO2_12_FULL_42_10]OGK52354.1 MAG: hypothetical protein A3B02_00575 [Candidatus Roizmanbacteria bacterium RIFCSPLOWO2_01_FULL_42_14]